MRIRRADESDAEKWLQLRRELWPDCPAEKHRIEIDQLLRSDGVVLVAEDEAGALVGFAEVSVRHEHVEGASICPVPYLEGWLVRARVRDEGIGGRLLSAAEDWARERGYAELASDAEIENDASIAIHRHLGFREAGRSVHFVKRL